jgi:hypothetical protein
MAPAIRKANRKTFLSLIGFFVRVVSIILQDGSGALYPVAEKRLQFRGLNTLQRQGDAIQQFLWLVEYPIDERVPQMAEKSDI